MDLDSVSAAESTLDVEAVPVKRGRGRPKGSTKKTAGTATSKVGVELPPQVVGQIAAIPLDLSAGLARKYYGLKVGYTLEQYNTCAAAMDTWLKSVDFDLTPGWALVIAYTMVIGTAVGEAAMAHDRVGRNGATVVGAAENFGGQSGGEVSPPPSA